MEIKIQSITKKTGKDEKIQADDIQSVSTSEVTTKIDFELKAVNSIFKAKDEVIVTYTEGNDSTKPIIKEGTYTITDNTKISITGLKDVSGMTVNFVGRIKVGDPNADANSNEAVMLSVRFGNMNKNRDWIIDLADRTNGAPGTYIKLTELIAWINRQNTDSKNTEISGSNTASTVVLEKPGGLSDDDFNKIDKEDFTIEIKALRFNITQKTFRIEVSSKQDETITFGAFTILKVGLLLTNERWTEEETKAISA